jgi:hypothetical protein
VPYAIGGSLCLAFWGVVRATKDLDLNVFVSDRDLAVLFDALEASGCEVDRTASLARARDRGDVVATWHDMRVDVFIAFHPLHDEVQNRVVRGELPGFGEVAFLSAEDLAIFKTLFHRPKDLADLHRLFAARANELDIAYVEHWLAELLGEDDPRVRDIPQRFANVRAHREP